MSKQKVKLLKQAIFSFNKCNLLVLPFDFAVKCDLDEFFDQFNKIYNLFK